MPLQKTCIICQKIFYVKPSHYNGRFCCSKKCQFEAQKFKLKKENNPNWKSGKTMKEKVCPTCKRVFIGYNQKFCCPKCVRTFKQKFCQRCGKQLSRYNYNKYCKDCFKNTKKKYKVKVICKKCGNEMTKIITFNQKIKYKKFPIKIEVCKKCRSKKIQVKCKNCGKLFKLYKDRLKSKNNYCSKHCSSSGKNNINWQGGIQGINSKIRNSQRLKEWKKRIFKRDSYTCQVCGNIGNILHAHHIMPFAYFSKYRFTLYNGITLCKKCHNEIPKIYSLSKDYIL